jgi:2'-5' RNA ligase
MKIKSFNQFNESKEEESKPVYEYGCSMIHFDLPELKEIHSQIDPKDIYNDPQNPTRYGLEKTPHVTLLYGFHDGWEHDNLEDSQVEEILDISSSFSEEPIILDNISVFSSEEYDVLKFDAHSEDLERINGELSSKYKWEKFYPKYHPHCTIAYLMPGKGKKYLDKFKGLEIEVLPKEVVYSRPDGDSGKEKFNRKIEIE